MRQPAAAAGAAPPAEWQPTASPWLIAVAVMLATFMEVLDTSVANVSLPHIGGSFAATPEEATWVLTSYLVSNAIVLPTTGWLAGTIGRKRLLIICILIFTGASALCGAAASLRVLIGARIAQGIGGGALQPIAQAILMESFPPARRGVAMAVFAMGIIVAPILGPTLGGFITDEYSWRWVFYINLPVGAVAILMAQSFIEDPPYIRRKSTRRVDYLGFGFMAIFLGTLQLVLDKGQEDDWFQAAWIRWFVAISATALVAFIVRELTVHEPIVDLRVLGDRNFAVGTVMVTVVGMVLYGTTAMLPLFLQTLLGYSAVDAGLAVSPRGLGALLASMTVGRLVGRLDNRLLMTAGFGLMALSGFLFSGMNLDVAMTNVVTTNIVNGFANPLVFIAMSTTSMGTLRNEQMGNATGIYNLMRNTGASIGIAAMTTLLARGAQVHQVELMAHVTPFDPAYRLWLDRTTQDLAPRLGAVDAGTAALGLLYDTVVRQATLLAYLDNFRRISVLAILCVPLVFLFRKGRVRRGEPVH